MNITLPELRPGERLIATIIIPNGRREHIILMAKEVQTNKEMTWQAAMDFAKDAGGELPDRVESALLFATKEEGEFELDWYWTREQGAGFGSYAWVQSFDYGYQDDYRKDNKYRVVLVRRIAI